MVDNPTLSLMSVDWPAASQVRAMFTTRNGGCSHQPFASFNLGDHVGDQNKHVGENRSRLQTLLECQNAPFWLNQVHGNQCVEFKHQIELMTADASVTRETSQPLVVLTADCLPVLLCNRQGDWVAACHAGWRGLAAGVIQNTIARYPGPTSDLIGWIGPAISQDNFEVGSEVLATFKAQDDTYQEFFKSNNRQRYQFDFIGLSKQILANSGVEAFGGQWCTFDDSDRFFSYRRDGETGRMASLIWIEKPDE